MSMSMSIQSRLAALARRHRTALLLLTASPCGSASLGPLVAVRLEARRVHRRGAAARFACEVATLKDKRRDLHRDSRRDPRQDHRHRSVVIPCRPFDGLC